jgi:hypothetical protein
MRLRFWDWVGVFVGVLVAADEFLLRMMLVGSGVLVGTVVWILVRIEISTKPGHAAGYVTRRAHVEAAQTLLLMVAIGITVAAGLGVQLKGWNRTAPGNLAIVALVALEFMLLVEMTRRGNSALRWFVGSEAERAVAAELDPLRDKGWLVVHDWPRVRGGNIDHVVCGPSGAFAIETKSGNVMRMHVSQAAGAAVEIQRKLGRGWVQAVVASDTVEAPYRSGVAWVVPTSTLRVWLAAQHGQPVEVGRAASLFSLEPAPRHDG